MFLFDINLLILILPHSIDDLKDWVADTFGIKQQHQLLLTKNAVQVKIEGIVEGQCIYLYDKSLISNKPQSSLEKRELKVDKASYDNDINSVLDAKSLFVSRARWAVDMLTKVEDFNTDIDNLDNEIDNIKQGIKVAVSNLHTHSTQLEKSFYLKDDFLKNFEDTFVKTSQWHSCYDSLAKVNVGGGKTLAGWLDRGDIETAFSQCVEERKEAKRIIDTLNSQVIQVINEGHSLENTVKKWVGDNKKANQTCEGIIKDMKSVVIRIENDSENVSSMDESEGNVNECKRLSNLHIQEFLKQVENGVENMHEQLNRWIGYKREAQNLCIDYLKQVSSIQYRTSLVRPELSKLGNSLEKAEENRVKVAKAIDLPFLYGMWLIEQYRRNQWVENMKNVVNQTAESIGTLRENEIRQRRSYMACYGNTLNEVKKVHTDEVMPESDITFRPGETIEVDMQEIERYLNELCQADMMESHDHLRQELEDMMVKKKKEGSISIVSGEEDKDRDKNYEKKDKLILQMEGSIKGYATRIKKLEDLLYREQYNRRNSGDWSTSGTPIPPSNLSYVANGIMPMTPPKQSSQQQQSYQQQQQQQQTPTSPSQLAISEKQYKQLNSKVKQLEEQRVKDGEKIRELEEVKKDVVNKLEKAGKERDGAEAVKKDLLSNFTNLESEFSRERRQLNQEISELKLRIEELEEENEREGDKASEIINKHEVENGKLVERIEQLQQRERDNSKAHSQELDQLIEREQHLQNENTRLSNDNEIYYSRCKDLSQKYYTSYRRSCELLECMGLQAQKEIDNVSNQVESFTVKRVRGISRRAKLGSSNTRTLSTSSTNNNNNIINEQVEQSVDCTSSSNNNFDSTEDEKPVDEYSNPSVLYWMDDMDNQEELYQQFMNEVYFDYDMYRDAVVKRFSDVEKLARKSQKYNSRMTKAEQESYDKLAFKSFKPGDLALFLPTRDEESRARGNNSYKQSPWAAFNVNAPHYFLRAVDEHKLQGREWLVARISNVEERVVDRSVGDDEDENANPFDLSDGLKWHLLDAVAI